MAKRKKHFDPEDLLAEIIERNIDPTVFSDLNEGDIPKAKNCVEFFINRKFHNSSPFPRQLQIALELFEEWCPDCSDPKILHNMFDQDLAEILDRVQLLHFGRCPKCKKTKWDFYNEGKMFFRDTLKGCAGQRSGKSYLISEFLLPYVLHRYLTLGSRGKRITPQKYFKILPSTTLTISCVARTVGRAQKLLWAPFTQSLSQSPWFTNYHEFLRDYEKRKGEEILFSHKTYLFYGHKLIGGSPAAPDISKLRGDTRIAEAVDEIDWFDTDEASKKQTLSAEEIATSLNNSLRTVRNKAKQFRDRRNHWITGYTFHISSPSSVDGKILRDIASARTVKTIAPFHYPTWEMNPEYTRESLDDEYSRDPIKAARDFGAVPPLADSPFFENVGVLTKCIRNEKQFILNHTVKRMKDSFGDSISYILVQKKQQVNTPMCMTIDMGHSQNGFSIALGHLEEHVPYLDFIINLEPDVENNIIIDSHLMFENAIIPILDNFNITHVAYDHWNSLDGVRRIRNDYEIEADQYTIKASDFENVIYPCINDPEGISYPKPGIDINKLDMTRYDREFSGFEDTLQKAKECPIATMMLQMLTVRKVGMRVIKPVMGNDDAFRALALLIVYLRNEDINYKFRGTGVKPGAFKREGRMGSVVTYTKSSGGSRVGTQGGSVTRIAKLASKAGGGKGQVNKGRMGRIAKSR